MRPLILLPALLLAACATAPEAASGAEPRLKPALAAPELTAEEQDPFFVAIEIERYGVLIGLAKAGAIEGPPAMTLPDPAEPDWGRPTAASRYAARELYELREINCAHHTVAAEHCGALPPPAWLGEPPDAVASPEELRARIDWLTAHMGPHVEAGCDAGDSRRGPDDPPYCAVE